MNKKFINGFLLASLVVGSGGILSSCKDYDDDIDQLRQEVAVNKSAIESINSQIANGAILESVASDGNGGIIVTVKKNGQTQTYNIEKGATGATGATGAKGEDAVIWTIEKVGDTYFWKEGDKITNYPAQGPKGDPGQNGDPGASVTGPVGPQGNPGDCWKPNDDGTALVKYVWDAKTTPAGYKKAEPEESVKIAGAESNKITAVLDNGYLYLHNVQTGTNPDGTPIIGSIAISRTGLLTGLGFIPNLYADGVEAARTAYANDVYQYAVKTPSAAQNVTVDGKTVSFTIPSDWMYLPYATTANRAYELSELSSVEFNMNPDNANINGVDFRFRDIRNVEAISVSRAAQPSLNMIEANSDGNKLTVNYKVVNPLSVVYTEGSKNTLPVSALYAMLPKSETANVAESEITSDYFALVMSRASFTELTFGQKDSYAKVAKQGDSAVKGSTGTSTYKTLDVLYTGSSNLKEQLCVTVTKRDFNKGTTVTTEHLSLKELETLWGLKAKFTMMNYEVGESKTNDSQYAKIDAATGILTPQYVGADGKTQYPCGDATDAQKKASRAAIGKHPVVLVTIYDGSEDNVVLVGYVKFNIMENIVPEKMDVILVDGTPMPYVCSSTNKVESTWGQMSYLVLSGLGISAEQFKAQYIFDATNVYVKTANATESDPAQFAVTTKYGDLTYDPDSQTGLANGFLTWEYDKAAADEIAKLNPRAVTVYGKFTDKNDANRTLYLGLTINLMASPSVKFGTINKQYLVNGESQHVAMGVLGVKNTENKSVEYFQATLAKYYNNKTIVPTIIGDAAYNGQSVSQVYKFAANGQMSGLKFGKKYGSTVDNTALLQGTDTIATIDPVSGVIVYANSTASKSRLNAASTAYANVEIATSYGSCGLPFASVLDNTNIVKVDFDCPLEVVENKNAYQIYRNGYDPFTARLGGFFTMHDAYDNNLFVYNSATGMSSEEAHLAGIFKYYEIESIEVDFTPAVNTVAGVNFSMMRNGVKATPIRNNVYKFVKLADSTGFSVEILNQAEVVVDYVSEKLQEPVESYFNVTVNYYWGSKTVKAPINVNPKQKPAN